MIVTWNYIAPSKKPKDTTKGGTENNNNRDGTNRAVCASLERYKSSDSMSINRFLKKDVITIHFHWPPCCSLFTNPVCVRKRSLHVPERTLAQTRLFGAL